jgi:hypothetical protein
MLNSPKRDHRDQKTKEIQSPRLQDGVLRQPNSKLQQQSQREKNIINPKILNLQT